MKKMFRKRYNQMGLWNKLRNYFQNWGYTVHLRNSILGLTPNSRRPDWTYLHLLLPAVSFTTLTPAIYCLLWSCSGQMCSKSLNMLDWWQKIDDRKARCHPSSGRYRLR